MTTEPKCPHCDATIAELTYVDPVEHLYSMVMNKGEIHMSFEETNYEPEHKEPYVFCGSCNKESAVPFKNDDVIWE